MSPRLPAFTPEQRNAQRIEALENRVNRLLFILRRALPHVSIDEIEKLYDEKLERALRASKNNG